MKASDFIRKWRKVNSGIKRLNQIGIELECLDDIYHAMDVPICSHLVCTSLLAMTLAVALVAVNGSIFLWYKYCLDPACTIELRLVIIGAIFLILIGVSFILVREWRLHIRRYRYQRDHANCHYLIIPATDQGLSILQDRLDYWEDTLRTVREKRDKAESKKDSLQESRSAQRFARH